MLSLQQPLYRSMTAVVHMKPFVPLQALSIQLSERQKYEQKHLLIRLQDASSETRIEIVDVFTAGKEHHLALSFGPNGLDVYVDGVRVGLLLSSAAGNDLLFDEALCQQGKGFGNKIWSAFFPLIHPIFFFTTIF